MKLCSWAGAHSTGGRTPSRGHPTDVLIVHLPPDVTPEVQARAAASAMSSGEVVAATLRREA